MREALSVKVEELDILTGSRPQLLTVDVCHARETNVPIHEVPVESASHMGSQEECLSPDDIYLVLSCDGIEDIIAICCRNQDIRKENHGQNRRNRGVISDDINHVDGSDRCFHVGSERRRFNEGSQSLMDFKTSVGLCQSVSRHQDSLKQITMERFQEGIMHKRTQRIRCFTNAVNDSGASPVCNGARTKTTS